MNLKRARLHQKTKQSKNKQTNKKPTKVYIAPLRLRDILEQGSLSFKDAQGTFSAQAMFSIPGSKGMAVAKRINPIHVT